MIGIDQNLPSPPADSSNKMSTIKNQASGMIESIRRKILSKDDLPKEIPKREIRARQVYGTLSKQSLRKIPDELLPAEIMEMLLPLENVIGKRDLDRLLYGNLIPKEEKTQMLNTFIEISQYLDSYPNEKAHYQHKTKVIDDDGMLIRNAKGKCITHTYSWFIDERDIFIIWKKIAMGAIKRISRGIYLNTQQSIAVIVPKVKEDPKNELILRISQENTELMHSYKIPHIVPVDIFKYQTAIKDDPDIFKSIYIQTLFDGDASFFVSQESRKELPFEEKKSIYKTTAQILLALTKIHEKGYVHLDVKPHNIFLYKNEAFLADFEGLCKKNTLFNFYDFSVTSAYLSPELDAHNDGEFTPIKPSQDAYSMGVSLLTFLFGNEFIHYNHNYCRSDLAQNPHLAKEKIRENLNRLNIAKQEQKLLIRILLGLTHPDPQKRMSCKKAEQLMSQLNKIAIVTV